jgi:AraC family transcriptional regulator
MTMGHGDECLTLQWAPALVESIGGRTEVWRSGCLPPLLDLMVLGRADASSRRRQERHRPRPDRTAARGPLRPDGLLAHALAGGNAGAIAPKPSTRALSIDAIDLETAANEVGLSPCFISRGFSPTWSASPRTNIWCARGCAAPRGCSPTTRARSPISPWTSDFGDLSNFVRTFHRAAHVSPRRLRQAAAGGRKILQNRLARRSLGMTA